MSDCWSEQPSEQPGLRSGWQWTGAALALSGHLLCSFPPLQNPGCTGSSSVPRPCSGRGQSPSHLIASPPHHPRTLIILQALLPLSLLSIFPKKTKILNQKDIRTPYVHCRIIYNSQDMEATQVSINRWIDEDGLHTHTHTQTHTLEYYSAIKK